MLDEFRSTNITWDKATSRIYSPVTANASDENGRKLVVQIVNGGQVEDLTGATLHLYWETRDKAHDGLDVFDAVDLKKGEFELSYTTGMLSNQGVLNANLVLIDTVGRVVSERFKITVTEGIDNDAIQSENSFSSLTKALIEVGPRLNDLTAQLQHKADQVQANSLQQQINTIVLDGTAGDSSAEVNQARVDSNGTIFPTVKSHLDNIEKNITSGKTNLVLSGWEIGNIAGDGLNATSALRIRTIGYHPVTVGDTLKITPQLGYYAYVRFYDANNVFKSSQTVTEPISITIPQPQMRVVIREEIETTATLYYADKIAFETDFKLVGQAELEARVETNESGIIDLLATLEEGLFRVDVGSFEVGGLDLNTGAPYSANYYLRSVGFIDAQTYENLVVKIDGTGYRYMAFAYDASFSYVTRQSGFTSSSQSEITIKYPFYKIMLNITGNPTIPLSDANKFKFYTIKNLSLTDTRPLKGQVGVMFGDSLTELSFGITEKIVSDVTGATVYNCGVSGSKMGCINPLDPDAIDELSGTMLVEAIVNQDFTNVWSGNNRLIASSGDDNTRIIETLESLNFADVDFVTFAHGHNDYHFDLPLGTITDTGKGTWYGAINYVIKALGSAYPNLKFYFFTPPFRARHSLGDGLSSDVQTNDNGVWLKEFCDAEELACIKNHVPCKNMLNTSGINAFNHAYWLIDGLHGTDAGYKMLASKYAEFIINN